MVGNITWDPFAYPNITGFNQALAYANSTTGGYFGMGLCLSTFLILFMIFKRYGTDEALMASSFIGTILTGILRMMGAVDDTFLVIFIVLTTASILISYSRRR